jgi:hypothetical protein
VATVVPPAGLTVESGIWKDRAVHGSSEGPVDGERHRSAETARSLAMLLGTEDLGGPGWTVVEERTWPTGELDPASDKSRRALDAGGITAWRSLAQPEPPSSAWVEVVPYASAEDAVRSLRQVPRYFVGTSKPGEEVTAERVVEDRTLPGVRDTWMFEKAATGPEGAVVTRYAGGTVDRILFLTCLSGAEGRWSWPDLVDLATRQAARVRSLTTAPRTGRDGPAR